MFGDITIKCRSCGYKVVADHKWAEFIEPGATYPSSASIYSFVEKVKKRLRCSECGSKEVDVILENLPDKQPMPKPEIPEHYKRYVDEGLAGSREDHKKMSARQWSDMIKRHRE
jgi:DNA-directed RNA polymerase subunit RPC12/RpoP